jgi:hypothetical protein
MIFWKKEEILKKGFFNGASLRRRRRNSEKGKVGKLEGKGKHFMFYSLLI